MLTALNPGDVVAVDTGSAAQDDLIRLGALLDGTPAPANHVVIVHHRDKAGTLWGIEGRPGGVGYVDMAKYTGSALAKYANSNTALARTAQQSHLVLMSAERLLGTPYDWAGGIAADALTAFGLGGLAKALDRWWGWPDASLLPHGTALRPAHVVCSSLAQWVYAHLGLPCPKVRDAELCTPADWWAYNAAIGLGVAVHFVEPLRLAPEVAQDFLGDGAERSPVLVRGRQRRAWQCGLPFRPAPDALFGVNGVGVPGAGLVVDLAVIGAVFHAGHGDIVSALLGIGVPVNLLSFASLLPGRIAVPAV